jgi:hypothetical protein
VQARSLSWIDLSQSQVDDLNKLSTRPELSQCVLSLPFHPTPTLDLALSPGGGRGQRRPTLTTQLPYRIREKPPLRWLGSMGRRGGPCRCWS